MQFEIIEPYRPMRRFLIAELRPLLDADDKNVIRSCKLQLSIAPILRTALYGIRGCNPLRRRPSGHNNLQSACPGPSFLRVPAYFPPCAGAHPDPAVTTNPVLEPNTASPAAPQPTHPLIPTIRMKNC
jgi:hypothetical protein